MRWYVECDCTAPPIFGNRKPVPHTRSLGVVEAKSGAEACRKASRQCSVYELRYVVTIRAYSLGRPRATLVAKYDGEPMIDHRATGANLVFERKT